MSKTPRTDSMIRAGADDDDFERGINLCRRLETELNEARAEIEQMQDALRWVSADDTYKNDESFLCATGITDVVRAYQIGRANERERILKQKEFSRMERIIQDMKESEDNHFLSEIEELKE